MKTELVYKGQAVLPREVRTEWATISEWHASLICDADHRAKHPFFRRMASEVLIVASEGAP